MNPDPYAPNCPILDRFLCFLWALTLDFRVISKKMKKARNSNYQDPSQLFLQIKNIWNNQRSEDDHEEFSEKSNDGKSIFITCHQPLFSQQNVPKQIVQFFMKYYSIADNKTIFPYTKENLLPKTENGLSYITQRSNELSDWILLPNFVIGNTIRLCISIRERSKTEKLIMNLPYYNFYPQLSDSEEKFLDLCTVAIFKPEYGVDKWDLFCYSNQILTMYLTIESPFPDLNIKEKMDLIVDMMCFEYSSSVKDHIKKNRSSISLNHAHHCFPNCSVQKTCPIL